MSDYIFFEYTALIHLTRNPQESGTPIHCLAKMRAQDSKDNSIPIQDLKERANDLIFVSISPGPERGLSTFKTWQVDEARGKQLGDATEEPKHYSEGTVYRFEN